MGRNTVTDEQTTNADTEQGAWPTWEAAEEAYSDSLATIAKCDTQLEQKRKERDKAEGDLTKMRERHAREILAGVERIEVAKNAVAVVRSDRSTAVTNRDAAKARMDEIDKAEQERIAARRATYNPPRGSKG